MVEIFEKLIQILTLTIRTLTFRLKVMKQMVSTAILISTRMIQKWSQKMTSVLAQLNSMTNVGLLSEMNDEEPLQRDEITQCPTNNLTPNVSLDETRQFLRTWVMEENVDHHAVNPLLRCLK